MASGTDDRGMMPLFLYGLLLDSVAQGPVRDLLRGLGAGRPAVARGLLYAVPAGGRFYPALLPGGGKVHGMVHDPGDADLAALDRFEDARPDDPAAGEFRRGAIEVTLAGARERVAAQAWWFNRAVGPLMLPIAHGNFVQWLKDTGAPAYAG